VDKTIRVWDAGIGVEMLPPLQGHNDWIYSVASSPDGTKIVSGSEDQTIRVWDLRTGIETHPPLYGRKGAIISVAFSPDGSKIISQSRGSTIQLWDANTGLEILPALSESAPNADNEVSIIHPLHSRIVSLNDEGWFTDLITGRYLGKLPISTSHYLSEVQRSCYVGWAVDHKPVILQFPV
jgi:WD40 repeat protein